MPVRIGAPAGYQFNDTDMDRIRLSGCDLTVTDRPEEAVEGADVVYGDVWTSMGQEDERDDRLRQFEGFTVDEALMDRTANDAVYLHCLPAHRGEEVSAGVIDGSASRVWPQAQNRMHAARGLIAWLLQQPGATAGPANTTEQLSA